MAILIQGYKEFQRDLKRAMGQMPKALGEAHKEVGKKIILLLQPPPTPAAVGSGAGATVRPSATKREVILKAGYGGRVRNAQQWGKIHVNLFHSAPARPYILQTALDNEDVIRQELIDQLIKALGSAFASAG